MKTGKLFRVLGENPAALEVPFALLAHANRNRAAGGNAPHQEGERKLAVRNGVTGAFTRA